jgi:RHS repeat-associated protein
MWGLSLTSANVYFGSRLIAKGVFSVGGGNDSSSYVLMTSVATDRLGSIGKFYPFGQERPSATANDKEKFTGYYRDAATGLDYAVNRYHQPGVGRFMTADPAANSAKINDPGSWNRYAYVVGDPANRVDRSGECPADTYWNDPWDCPEGPDSPYPYGDCTANVFNPFGICDGSCPSELLSSSTCYQNPGNPGGGAPDPGPTDPPLTCSFTGYTTQTPGFRSGTNIGVGFDMPINFNFTASGGTGSYSWSDTQTYSVSGYITYQKGIINAAATGTESLNNVGTGASASFFDAPGQSSKSSRFGKTLAASLDFSFSLSVSVTSGDQTVDCPVVNWSATLNWSTNKRGKPIVTGIDTVQTPPTP